MQINETIRGPGKGPSRNHFLASLPAPLSEKLAAHLTRVELPPGYLLVNADRDIQWLYFLEQGMASITSLDAGGAPVEVGVIGREGLVGYQALLGQARTHNTTIMQGAGEGLRIRPDIVREQLLANAQLMQSFHTFLYVLLEQTTQLVLCNRLHELEERLARWLLMTCDFMRTRAIHLTQEFLAEMLGVGRPAVTLAAGILQRNGLIAYSRGLVEVTNAEKLESFTCECYHSIRRTYRATYPGLY